jgi:hypothetical protein
MRTTPSHNAAWRPLALCLLSGLLRPDPAAADRIQPPPAGRIYHGVYPGGVSGEEDDLTPADAQSYEQAAWQHATWIYFSHNWYDDRAFPSNTASWIRSRGSVPYIRMMLRSSAESALDHRETVFTLSHILAGDFDADLQAWAASARDFGSPLIVEYGTECNGYWFPWNSVWNGLLSKTGYGDPAKFDGPERFAAAYRRIVQIADSAGASNIVWVFHLNAQDDPAHPINRIEEYYPGDDVMDWMAISAYGPQTPQDDVVDHFRPALDACYARLQNLAPGKPVVIAEFGCTSGNPLIAAEVWAWYALIDLLNDRWPNVIGFSWWNERWENDGNPAHDTTMRLQDNPVLQAVFRYQLRLRPNRLQTAPVFGP